MSAELAGRVVLITGAAAGLGSAYVEAAAAAGARVVAHDAGVARDGSSPDPSRIMGLTEDWRARGLDVTAAAEDLATAGGCAALIAGTVERHGRVDGLLHSAGIVRYGGIEQTSPEEWQRMLDVNVSAAWWLCRAVWPHMRSRGFGRIVLTVSAYGLRAYDDSDVTAYGMGKAAQFGLMNGLAGEGRQHGILVNAIEPIAATRIFRADVPEGDLRASDVAPAAVALLSPECHATALVVDAAGGAFGAQRYPASDRREMPSDLTAVLSLINAASA